MTASIDDLLGLIYTEAFAIESEPSSETRLGELLTGWPPVAARVVRVLKTIPISPTSADTGLASMLAVLSPVAQPELPWRAKHIRYVTDPHLQTIGSAYGAIADLLVDESTEVLADPLMADQFRRALLGPLAIAADATLALWTDNQRTTQRWQLHWIRALAEPYLDRSDAGPLGVLAAVPADEPTLDGAIRNWGQLCREALMGRQTLSASTFETAARGLLMITATAAVALSAIDHHSLLKQDPAAAIQALTEAHEAWKVCAVWRAHVSLSGPPRPDLRLASQRLREAVDAAFRLGKAWASPDVILQRTPPRQLMATVRRALSIGNEIAAAHFDGLNHLVRGTGQLWIAASELSDNTHRSRQVHGRSPGSVGAHAPPRTRGAEPALGRRASGTRNTLRVPGSERRGGVPR